MTDRIRDGEAQRMARPLWKPALQLLVAIAAAVWAQRNLWDFQPTAYRWTAGIVVALVLLILFGGALYNRYRGPNHEAIERRLALQSRVRAVLRGPGEYTLAPGDAGRIPEFPDANAAVLLIGETTQVREAGVDAQNQVLVFPNAEPVQIQVFVPFQDGRWEHQSSTHFENHQYAPTVLQRDAFKAALSAAGDLVCVGLASRRDPNADAERIAANEAFARRRAHNLCLSAATAVGQGRAYHALTVGYANLAAESPVEEAAQRVAVIIGVRGARQNEIRGHLQTILAGTRVRNVDLSAYSLSGAPELQSVSVNWNAPRAALIEDPGHRGAE